MEGDADSLLAGDDVVIRDDVAFLTDDHPRALALGGVATDPGSAPEIHHPLRPDACGIDADHRGHHRLGQTGILIIQTGENLHVAQIESRAVWRSECLRTGCLRPLQERRQ